MMNLLERSKNNLSHSCTEKGTRTPELFSKGMFLVWYISNRGCNLRMIGRESVGKHMTLFSAVTLWSVTSFVVLNEKIIKELNFLWTLQLVTWQIASAAEKQKKQKGRLGFAWRNNEDIKTSWLWEFPVRRTSYLLLFVKRRVGEKSYSLSHLSRSFFLSPFAGPSLQDEAALWVHALWWRHTCTHACTQCTQQVSTRTLLC